MAGCVLILGRAVGNLISLEKFEVDTVVFLSESRYRVWGSERNVSMKRLMRSVFRRSGCVKFRAEGVRLRS